MMSVLPLVIQTRCARVGNADPQFGSWLYMFPNCQTVGVMLEISPPLPCPSAIMSTNCACVPTTPSRPGKLSVGNSSSNVSERRVLPKLPIA